MIKNSQIRDVKLKTIFLIDAIGAITTAFLLMVVLRTFNQYIGLSKAVLSLLSIIAVLFAVYSSCCFMFSNKDSRKLLKPIIVANLAYCILTIGLLIFYQNSIKPLGVIYFAGEILVIFVIVYIELKALNTKS
jgi:hypothetical protein